MQPPVPNKQTFAQVDRKALSKLSKLTVKQPTAGAALSAMVALMDRRNAVCVSHKTLAKMLGVHQATMKRAIQVLKDGKWIQQVQLGATGSVNVYVINSRVAWADRRENLRLAMFNAVIVADAEDQDEMTLSTDELLKVPMIYPPELPLPTGEIDVGDQHDLPGFEPVIKGASE